MATEDADQLKRLTITALFSVDQLVDRLVLKGGNALNLAYGLSARASFDLDFSMEGQFGVSELGEIARRVEFRLKQAFDAAGYVVFDVMLEPKPENITSDLEDFWGGYSLEFKLITRERHDELHGELGAIQREAIPARPGGKARMEVDISRHEYCSGKQPVEIDEFTVYVYTPTMIVCEKIRAICQQMSSYASYVKKHRAPRARDFFDIHETLGRFGIDLFTDEAGEPLRSMFHAKRVPLDLLSSVEKEREFHRADWDAVRDTVHPRIRLREFDFYFDYVVDLCRKLASSTRR